MSVSNKQARSEEGLTDFSKEFFNRLASCTLSCRCCKFEVYLPMCHSMDSVIFVVIVAVDAAS